MKITFFFHTVILVLFLMNSCTAPMSKESYMEGYMEFIEEISEEYKDYDDKDWEKRDEKFKKYSGEWYNKFKEEYTWQDEIVLAKYSVQYNVYKSGDDVKGFFEDLFGTKNEIEEKIKNYVENEMEEDLEDFIDQAKEVSDSAESVVKELIKKCEDE